MGDGTVFSVKDLASMGMGLLKRHSGRLKALGSRLSRLIAPAADRILDKIPEAKRKPVLFCAGTLVLLLIVVVIFFLARGQGRARPVLQEPVSALSGDELFLPPEPDFVPDFLPAREPKRPWKTDDTGTFWKDPLRGREELWREKMRTVIDELMETVP